MFRTFRLTNEVGGLGLSCTQAGLTLAGIPLLCKTAAGFVPRPAAEIASLIKAAYGDDPTRLQSSVKLIAESLNRGNFVRAAIAAVLTATPELSTEAAERLTSVAAKLSKYDEDEPRDWHGRWTDEGADLPDAQSEAREKPVPESTDSVTAHLDNSTQIGTNADEFLRPVVFTGEHGETDSDDSQNPSSREETFERKYDDLGPVEFSKEAIQFGDWLGRNGQNLTADEKAQAVAEYAFIQDRLNFWQAYDYTPAVAQLNLHSAALTLYQGAVNGGLVGPGDLPESMLDVAGGVAIGTDSAPSNIRPATVRPDFELPHPAAEKSPKEVEGFGGEIDNSEVGIVSGKGTKGQGDPWETYGDEHIENAQKLHPNATGFDQFNYSIGEATDTKTLNTLTVSRIKKPQSILSDLKGYINDREDYVPIKSFDLDPELINSKTIHLAVPQYTSPKQWLYLNLAVRYARDHGLSLVITRIKNWNP
jgi:hypothetical protein